MNQQMSKKLFLEVDSVHYNIDMGAYVVFRESICMCDLRINIDTYLNDLKDLLFHSKNILDYEFVKLTLYHGCLSIKPSDIGIHGFDHLFKKTFGTVLAHKFPTNVLIPFIELCKFVGCNNSPSTLERKL